MKRRVWSVECEVWSGEWSFVECDVESVEC